MPHRHHLGAQPAVGRILVEARTPDRRDVEAREAHTPRAMLLMTPGWVRTALGGPEGRLSIDESEPGVVDVLLAKPGRTVRW